MKKITDFIVEKRNFIIILFIFFAIISVWASNNVKINYDMTEYLPSDSETRIGMDIMNDEFEEEKESYLNVMFKNLQDEQKDSIYQELSSIEGVSKVDYEKDNDKYNTDEYTLYILTIGDIEDSKTATDVYNKLQDMYKDYEFYTSGNVAERNMVILPTWILVLAVAICLVILIIMCESYVEPFLFLFCIGLAILLNNGTNIFLGTISNITSSISAILQLALSMDYSIMLINRYRQEKALTSDKVVAMKEALHKSFSAISSSSLTTIVGLLALLFMSFTIGRDLGLVLAKGVLLSLLVIFTCLPALILMFDKLIEKTKKKALNIKLKHLGNISYKCRYIGFILLIIIFVGSYLLKGNLGMLYTASEEDEIAKVFPENNQIAIIYNNKDEVRISEHLEEIENTNRIDEVLAYGNTINENLKYNEFNAKLDELGLDTEIEEYLLKILYYKYYNNNEERTMSFNEFVNFTKNNVLNNENFSSKLDSSAKENIEKLGKFTSKKEMNKKRGYSEIANILDINKNDAFNLFVYYYKDKVNTKLTIDQFINFVSKDVLTNKEYSSSIPKEAVSSINTVKKYLNKDAINKSMDSKEMATFFGIDEAKVNSLYLYYQLVNETNTRMSLNEFSNFVLTKIVPDKNYSSMFDEKTIQSLKLLNKMSNSNKIKQNMNTEEIAKFFGIDETLVKKVLILKYGLNDFITGNTSKWTISPYDFTVLIINNVSNNEELGNMIDSKTLETLKTVYGIMESSNKNIKYSYGEISKFIKVDSKLTKKIYTLYDSKMQTLKLTPITFSDFILANKDDETLSKNIDKKTVSNLKLVNTIMKDVKAGKLYSSSEIATLLSLNKEDIKLLYSLYSAKYINTNMSASLREFTDFVLRDVVTNEKYKSKFTNEQISKLNTIKGIMNSVINNVKYTPDEIFAIISKLTDSIDGNTVELLYIYYGSENYYKDEWTLTLETFINYVNDTILPDERFTDFIDDDMRKEISDAKTDIKENKEKLVGDKYSRVILNTTLDLESDETYEFLQNIYDKLNGCEFYIIGDSPMSYEMSKTFENEFNFISIITMLAIFVVVAFTFKSIGIPIILVLLIQSAVYMTMGILGILGESVYFIAVLIVQSILMGATIDYAIVYTTYYLESRENNLDVKESIINAYNKSICTILTSSSILIIATFLVGAFASGIVSKICKTLAQGVFCSTVLILLILPPTLAFVDKFIMKKKRNK